MQREKHHLPYKLRVMLRTNVKQGPRVQDESRLLSDVQKIHKCKTPLEIDAPASFVCCEHVNYATSKLKVMLKVYIK